MRFILFLFLVESSVFCVSDGSVTSVFSSLRRIDNSDEKTYHLSKVATNPFIPVRDPIIYMEGNNDDSKMIVGFQNMLIFGMFETEKHYVIRVNEDLDQDFEDIPSHFLNDNDSGELFDIVTLKPTPTTTTTATTAKPTRFMRFADSIKDIQREALPGFDPDTQSLVDYLQQVSYNMSKLSSNANEMN